MYLFMFFWSSFDQYSALYSLQDTDCFPYITTVETMDSSERNESSRYDYYQSLRRILATKRGIERAPSCSQVQFATDWPI